MKRIVSIGATLGIVLSVTLAGSVSAHTGSIAATQDCHGYSITAHLDSNVAASATWAVDLDGVPLGNGTGPGPDELGPFTGSPTAGTAQLVIVFDEERNVYSTELTLAEDCEPTPAPGFTVDKGVSLSAAGPFVADLTTTTGTTVNYRITITNTGNVALTGVTLSDNTYNLVTKGCVVPTGLAVGAHYDCNYTATATTGSVTNIATGDTDQTGPDTGTATVVAGTGAVAAETNIPTAPRTDVLTGSDGNSAPGSSLMLVLAGLGLLVVGVRFATPVPAPVRRRNRG